MSRLLKKCGFALISLEDFSLQFAGLPTDLPPSLQNIYISPKIETVCPDEDEIEFKNMSPDTTFQMRKIFESISVTNKGETYLIDLCTHFKETLTLYILNDCFMFVKNFFNCFEPLTYVQDVHETIERFARKKKVKVKDDYDHLQQTRQKVLLFGSNTGVREPVISTDDLRASPDIFADIEKCNKPNSSFKRIQKNKIIEIYRKLDTPVTETVHNLNSPAMEEFTLNFILYDTKHTTSWPQNHVLTTKSVDNLLLCIIETPLLMDISLRSELVDDSKNWKCLRNILHKLLLNHRTLVKYNGIGRIFEKHCRGKFLLGNQWKKKKRCVGSSGKHDGSGLPEQRPLNSVPKSVISSFLIDICSRLLPKEFFYNRKSFIKWIVRLVNFAKHQSFILHPIVEPFLQHKDKLTWTTEMKDDFVREIMIIKTVKWFIFSFIAVVLKIFFYITETGTSSNGLSYYLKCDLDSASFHFVNDMLYYNQLKLLRSRDQELFNLERRWLDTGKLDEKDYKRKVKKFLPKNREYIQPIAKVRLLPKKQNLTELRMITNISKSFKLPNISRNWRNRRRVITKSKSDLINKFLKRQCSRKRKFEAVKLFLELILESNSRNGKPFPHIGDLEASWLRVHQLKQLSGELYFVKADIAEAFQSVRHKKLRAIIDSCCFKLPGQLQLKKVSAWKLRNGRPSLLKKNTFGDSVGENTVFKNVSIKGCRQKLLSSFKVKHLKHILGQILFWQRIKIGKRVFRLREGLAQGCAGLLSPLLCELYYSKMDEDFFKEFLNSKDCVFIRRVDDYLFISNDKIKTRMFYEKVYAGIEEYNARFNREKLISNVDSGTTVVNFFGFTFNFIDGTVRPDYSRYANKHLLHCMFLGGKGMHFKKYKTFQRRLLNISSLKLNSILLNNSFNDISTLRQNIFDACLFQAVRTLCLLRYLFAENKNDLDIFVVVYKCLNVVSRYILSYCNVMSYVEIRWIYFYAFLIIFQRFSGQYSDLISFIKLHFQAAECFLQKCNLDFVLKTLKVDVGFNKELSDINCVFKCMVDLSKEIYSNC